jgi:hypothetical protein
MLKELFIGFVVGLIATLFGCFLFIEFFSEFSFEQTLEFIRQGDLEGEVLVLGALANFFVFFVFIKKRQMYRARGVILETLAVAFGVLLLSILQ